MGPISPGTVVIVNGDAGECARLAEIAKQAGHHVLLFQTAHAVLLQLAPPPRAVLVVDSEVPDVSPGYLIDTLIERGVYLPLVVTIPSYGISDAVNAIRQRAIDVLENPFGAHRFLQSINTALQSHAKPGG